MLVYIFLGVKLVYIKSFILFSHILNVTSFDPKKKCYIILVPYVPLSQGTYKMDISNDTFKFFRFFFFCHQGHFNLKSIRTKNNFTTF